MARLGEAARTVFPAGETIGSLGGLDTASIRSAVVTAAMPPGVNAFLFASMYQSAQRVAASTVLISTLLSVLSSAMWLDLLP